MTLHWSYDIALVVIPLIDSYMRYHALICWKLSWLNGSQNLWLKYFIHLNILGCAEDKLAAVGSCLVTENEDNNVVVDGTKIEKMSDESQISIDEISDSASHANKEFCTGPPSSDAHTLEDTTVGNFTIELSQNGDDESKDSALLVPKETNPAAEITGDTAGISPHNSPQSTCIKSCLVGSDKPAERSPMNVSFSTPLICYHEYPVSQCTQSTQDINEVLANTENLSLYDDTETNVMDSAGCYGPPSETAMGLLLSAKIEDVSNEEDDTPPTTEVLESQSISQEVITKETVRLCDVASNSELHTTSDSQEQATNCVEIIIEDLISHTFASREKASHGVKVVVGDIHHTNKYTDEQVPGNLEPISDGCLSQDNVSCIKDEREISDKGKLGYGIAEQLQLEEHERSGDIDKEGQCLCLNGTNDVVQSMIEPDIHTEELNHVSQIRQDTDSNGERRIPLSRDMNAKETIAPLSEVCIHGELEKDVEHNVTEITCNLKSYPEKVLSDDNSNTESTINTIPDSNETSPCNIDDDSNSPPANTTKTTFGLKSIDKDQNKSIFESVGDEETCHDIDSNSVEYIQSIGDTTSEGLKTEHFNEPTVSETPQTMCHDLSPDIQSSSSSVTANETAKGGNSSQTVCDQKLSAEVNSDQTASSSPDEKSTRIDAEHENQRDNEESVSYKEPDVMINTDDIESNIFKIDNTGPCVESVYTPVLTGVHLEIVKEKYKEIEAERIRVTNKYQVENPIPMEEDTEQETGRYDSQSNSSDRLVIALGEPGQTDICGTEIPDANDSSDTTNVNLDTNASHDNMAHVNNENLNKDESNCEPGREMNSLSIVQRPVKEDALCTTDKSSEDKECVIRKLNRIEMSSMDMLEEEDTKSCSMEASDKEDDNDIRSESLDILVLPDVDVNAIIKTENMPCVESIKRCLHTFRDCNGQGDNHEVPDISLESYPISQTDLTVEYHNPQYKVDPFSTSPLTKEESLSQLLTPSECKPQQTSDQRSSQTSQSSSTNSFVTAKEVYICSQNSSQGSQIPNAEVGDNQEDEDVSYSSKTCSQISSQPSSQSDEECCSGGNEDTSSSPMLSESNEDDVTETITQGPVDSPKSLKRRHESSDMVTCDASPPKRRHGVSEEIEKGMDITCQQHEVRINAQNISNVPGCSSQYIWPFSSCNTCIRNGNSCTHNIHGWHFYIETIPGVCGCETPLQYTCHQCSNGVVYLLPGSIGIFSK